MQVLDNTPSAGCIQWSECHITYQGTTYTITDGYTNYIYVYWLLSNPTNFVVSDTFPTLSDNDVLVFLNKSGVHATVPNTTVIDGSMIVPESILANQIAANAVTTDKILAGAINADKIAANAIGATAIAAGVITGDKLVADAITAREIASSTITTNEIAANTITAANIAAGTITADSGIIADATITNAKIADATIANAKIANLDAGKITTGTFNADRIEAGTITTSKLSSNVGSSLDLSSNTSITSKVNTADLGTLITQNADSVKVAVGQIGGNNLLKNGGFETSVLGWSLNRNPALTTAQTDAIYEGKTLRIKADQQYGGLYQIISAKVGMKYTFQIMVYHSSVSIGNMYFGVIDPDTSRCYYQDNVVVERWRKYTKTFTAVGNRLKVYLYGTTAGSVGFFDNIKLEEGENATAWSPNANELKSNIVEITDDHLRATFQDGSYSEMVKEGFHHVSANGTYEYHYLTAVGSFDTGYVASGTRTYFTITISDEFKNKPFNAILSVTDVSGETIPSFIQYFDVAIESYDYTNVKINCSCIGKAWYLNGTNQVPTACGIFITVSYTVIA